MFLISGNENIIFNNLYNSYKRKKQWNKLLFRAMVTFLEVFLKYARL